MATSHPTRQFKSHAAMAGLGQNKKSSKRAYVFRSCSDSACVSRRGAAGESAHSVAAVLKVSASSVIKWAQRQRRTGSFAPGKDGRASVASPIGRAPDLAACACFLQRFANMIRIITAIGQQDFGLRPFRFHQGVKARIIRDLACGDLCGYRQSFAVRAEVNFSRVNQASSLVVR